MDIVRETEDYTAAVEGPLVVMLWHRATSLDGVDCFSASLANQLRSHKGVYVMHVVVLARPPEPKAKERINQVTERYGPRTRGSALVFEGGGFGAATVRAVVAGIAMLKTHPFPHRVFSHVDTALEWMSGLAKESGDPAFDKASAEIVRLRKNHANRYKRAS